MAWPTVSSTTQTDILLNVALVCFGLVVAFILATFFARVRTARAQKHREVVQSRWRPVLLSMASLGHYPEAIPPLPQCDALEFARFWIEKVNKIDGEGRVKLLELAATVDIATKLQRYLRSSNPGHLVLALCVSGWLKHKAAKRAIRRALQSKNATISFTAAMALIRLTGNTCAGVVLDRACVGDWGSNYIVKILRELKLENTTQEMLRMLDAHGPKQGGPLIQAWAQVDYLASAQYARDILANPRAEGWLLCGALRILKSPSDAAIVRPYLKHPQWSVRVQAVNAMARLGLRRDIEDLAPMMEEDNWWLQERVLDAVKNHPQISKSAAQELTRYMHSLAENKRTKS